MFVQPLKIRAAAARAAWSRLPRALRFGLLGGLLLPVGALAAVATVGAFGGGGGVPAGLSAAAPDAGTGTMLRGIAAVIPVDPADLLAELRDAGPRVDPVEAAKAPAAADPAWTAAATALMEGLPKDAAGNPDWARIDMDAYSRAIQDLGPAPTAPAPTGPVDYTPLDLDEALALLRERIDAEDDAVLARLRGADHGDQPSVLLAHSLALMLHGDVWGAAANLLVAHEADEDDATPLVNLAAIANGQNLPAVALALLDAAAGRDIGDDDSPVGIREAAAIANNRGHALLLLRRHDEAEAPLRAALAANPELSEAARNLMHLLLKTDREDEARALVPRAVWRLRGNPAQPVTQRAGDPEAPAPAEPPGGSPEAIAQWLQAPWVEERSGLLALPLWISLDLSKQGQIAWPEVRYPTADASYGSYFARAAADYVAEHDEAQALRERMGAAMRAMGPRRPNLSDRIQQLIEVKATTQSGLEPVDREMHRLQAWKETLILGSPQLTRFAALDVARGEFQMEEAAERLYQHYRRESACPVNSSHEECCAIHRRAIANGVAGMTPIAHEYEDRMRVFFREFYGLSTAIAANLPSGGWHDLARLGIEHDVRIVHARAQQEIAFAFAHAAPAGGGCYGNPGRPEAAIADIVVDAPACSAGAQWGSGKWAFSNNFSMEVTCGKVKFVAEVDVIGTKKLKLPRESELGGAIGMHAEVEFSIDGTVTVFAGPKASAAGKVGHIGADFGVKDGIYAVIGRDGVRDVGMRVVVGGGVNAGPLGGTHDAEVMDFSFVSAL
ncbi:hypothetical protein [Arenimonas composti]|uniref:Uncharacterized protein n=1 Tax=Arenimonas composti TR7-09 = DSM 18010 TaxID=1121013 RepID=A0A091BYW8_9GAMM|nr:hypothetical protein [Arenimonas composti]KFN49560.1 hypothetical protein P873_10425 [Arenimonas composti TR7-09 = DSM 18010]